MKKTVILLIVMIIISIPFECMGETNSNIVNDVLQKQQKQKEEADAAMQEMIEATPAPTQEESTLSFGEKQEQEVDSLLIRAERFKIKLTASAKSAILRFGPFYIGFAIVAIIIGNKKESWARLKKIGWLMIALFVLGSILILFASQIVDWYLQRVNETEFRL